MTTTVLKNGLRVGNFSSPHDFLFNDGSILPAVDKETSRILSLVKTSNDLSGGKVIRATKIFRVPVAITSKRVTRLF